MADGGSVTIKVLLDASDFTKGIEEAKKSIGGLGNSDPTKPLANGFKSSAVQANLLSKAAGACTSGLKKIGSTALGFGKVAVGAIGGVATAIGALTISGGIARAMGVSEAQAKMNQLGMDTSAVMESVKASVKQTKFSLNDAAGAAVTLGSAGISAGEDMTNALKSVASTASISGAEFSEIGAIYSKVAASGKLSTEVMNQLLERGVSVTAALSRSLGKTESEIKKMVTDGKIDFQTFSDAMYEYLGDASMSANSTFSGAMANVRAALARVGEAFANPMLETLRQTFVSLIPEIDGATTALQPLADGFAAFVGSAAGVVVPNLKNIIDWFVNLANCVGEFFSNVVAGIDFEGFSSAFGGVADALGNVFGGDQVAAAGTFGTTLANIINGLIPVIQMATPIIEALANVFKYVADNIELLLPCAITMMGVIVALGAVQKVASAFSTFSSVMGIAGNAVGQATPKMQMNAVQMMQMGVAAMALGAGLLIACAGLFILAQAAIQIAAAGPGAALAMVGLVGAIAMIAAGAAALGPALTAGALGFVAFGAAILLVGAGVMIACAGFAMLSGSLPMISAFGLQAAGGIMALGAAMLMAAPGAMLLGAGLMVCGAGAMVAGVGMTVLAASTMAAFIGLTLCSAPASLLGPALMQAGAGALLMGTSLLIVAASSLAAAPGLIALAACIGGVAIALGLSIGAFQGLSGAMSGIASSLSTSASSMKTVISTCKQMTSASTLAGNGMKSLGNASKVGATSVQSACQQIDRAIASLAVNVNMKIAQIKAAFAGMQLHIPSPSLGPMPHFSLSGRFDIEAGTVPTINVDWYATGGYANKATVLGGVGMGEAGGEGIVPLEGRHMYPMADAMTERMSKGFNFADLLAEVKALHRDLPLMLADYCDIRLMINDREFGRAARNAKQRGWLD